MTQLNKPVQPKNIGAMLLWFWAAPVLASLILSFKQWSVFQFLFILILPFLGLFQLPYLFNATASIIALTLSLYFLWLVCAIIAYQKFPQKIAKFLLLVSGAAWFFAGVMLAGYFF